jgi:hypothetical protein
LEAFCDSVYVLYVIVDCVQVHDDLCLAQEAYQFFRSKYKKRYGDYVPPPTTFLN